MLKISCKIQCVSILTLLATTPLLAMEDNEPDAGTSGHTLQIKPTKEASDAAVTTAKPGLQLQQVTATGKATIPDGEEYAIIDHEPLNAMMVKEALVLEKTLQFEVPKHPSYGDPFTKLYVSGNVSRLCTLHNTEACLDKNCSKRTQWKEESKVEAGTDWVQVMNLAIQSIAFSIILQSKKT